MTTDSKNQQALIAAMAILVIYAIFFLLIHQTGLLTFTGSDPSAKVIAASIALVGGLFSSVVTLFGLLLKYSIDVRTLALEERNEILAKEAESRLKEEAAIKSLELLGTSAGKAAPKIQHGGVLLALANLEKFSIALALADEMLSNRSLELGTYCWLIDKAIVRGDPVIRDQATLSLATQISHLPTADGGAKYPAALMQLHQHLILPRQSRSRNVHMLIDLVTVRPFADWNPEVLSEILRMLHAIYRKDDPIIRDTCGIALRQILQVFPEDTDYFWDNERIVFKDLADQLVPYQDWALQGVSYINGAQRMKNIQQWCRGEQVEVIDLSIPNR